METINIHQAETNLSRLLSRVEHGEEIVICNRGIPIAKLVPFRASPDRSISDIGYDACQRRFNVCSLRCFCDLDR